MTGSTFAMDLTAPDRAERAFDSFRGGWESQTGEAYPLPPFIPARTGGAYRIGVRASKLHDLVIGSLYGELMVGTTGSTRDHADDMMLMHVVQRGTWSFGPADGSATPVTAGQFSLRHCGRPTFEAAARSTATLLILPASHIRPLLGDQHLVGPTATAEMRVLMAHAATVETVLDDLTPGGADAARDAVVELVRGVVRQELDDTEPRLAPALCRAAKNLVDDRLADPDLSPTMLARELHVSVRTLHRAFATDEESVAGYIRRSRLERARRALAAPVGRPSISELAAHWQFADSSHLIRAFRKHYGQTPAQFVRSQGRTGG